jgi:hypothetical protein
MPSLPEASVPGTPVAVFDPLQFELSRPSTIATAMPHLWYVPVLDKGRLVAYYEVGSLGKPPTVLATDGADLLTGLDAAERRMKAAMGQNVRLFVVTGPRTALFGTCGDSFGLTFFQEVAAIPAESAWDALNSHDVYTDIRALKLVKTLYSELQFNLRQRRRSLGLPDN